MSKQLDQAMEEARRAVNRLRDSASSISRLKAKQVEAERELEAAEREAKSARKRWDRQALAWIVGLYPHAKKQLIRRKAESEGGIMGADKRWNKDEIQQHLNSIIPILAKRHDALGDPEEPNELWPLLYSEMEKLGCNLIEKESPPRYVKKGSDDPVITYDAFRKRIQRARN